MSEERGCVEGQTRAGRRQKHGKGRQKEREAQKRRRSKVGEGHQEEEEEEGGKTCWRRKRRMKICEKRSGRYRGEGGVQRKSVITITVERSGRGVE